MIASVYALHASNCPNRADRSFKRCRCPKWLYFESARTRSWEKAEQNARKKAREYEARELAAKEGQPVKRDESQPKTIDVAVELYLDGPGGIPARICFGKPLPTSRY